MSQMPMVANPSTKPNGDPFTKDDREFWELETTHLPKEDNGRGIRQYQYFPYPRMLYKAIAGGMTRESFERVTVQKEREHTATTTRDPAWCESKSEAAAFYERGQQDIARSAAEVASSVQTMSQKAKRQYRKRSAESPKHITE